MEKVKTLTNYNNSKKGSSSNDNNSSSKNSGNGNKNEYSSRNNSGKGNSSSSSNDNNGINNNRNSSNNSNNGVINTNTNNSNDNNTVNSNNGLLSSFMNSSIILDSIDTCIDANSNNNNNSSRSPKYATLNTPTNRKNGSNANNSNNVNSRNNSKKDDSIKRSNSVITINNDDDHDKHDKTKSFSTRTFRPKSAPFRNSKTSFDTTEQLLVKPQWKESVDVFFQNRIPVEHTFTATMNELATSEFAEYYENDDSVTFTPLGDINQHFNNHYRPRTGFEYHVAENVKMKSQTTHFNNNKFSGSSIPSSTRPGTVSDINLGQRKETLRSVFCDVKRSDILSPFVMKERRKEYPAHFFETKAANITETPVYDVKNFEMQVLINDHVMSDFEDIAEPVAYTIDDANYFGENAKNRFFARTREIAKEYTNSAGLTITKNQASESPRTKFIRKYFEITGKSPLPIIIRVDPDAVQLDIAHKQLKDDYIIALSDIVADLPRLTTVDVSDNNLTDSSMKMLVSSLMNQQSITELDLSNNDIDSDTADALLKLVGSPKCPLKVLKLSNADVDDDEIISFMDAFVINNSITHLDLSHNLIYDKMFTANMDLLSVLHLDPHGSGGAAIASSLYVNSTVTSINLSWNKLGSFSCCQISRALSTTALIIELNLSYNTIKDVGAEALGQMLFKNHKLKKLNISNNNITAKGCFILSGALRKNDVLDELIIDGNPIGYIGGEYLLETFNFHTIDRVISMKDCLFSDKDAVDHSIFDKHYPGGTYNLNLNSVYSQVVMLDLLFLAAVRRGCTFKSLEYTDDVTRVKTNVKLVRPCNPAPLMGPSYSTWKKGVSRGRHPYTNIDAKEWMEIVEKLMLIDSATGKTYKLPNHGLLRIEFLYNPRLPTPIECINKTGMSRLMQFFHTHKKDMAHIQKFGSSAFKFETFQVHEILESIKADLNKTEIIYFFINFVKSIVDSSNMDFLIRSHFPSNYAVKEIKLNCRHIFNTMNNCVNGHYRLNLSHEDEHLTAIKLFEINNDDIAYVRRTMPEWKAKDHGYTSQMCGSVFPSNFRNITFAKAPIDLNEQFFSHGLRDKTIGVLEFDYISTSRPAEGVKGIASYDLNALLLTRSLEPLESGLQIAINPSASSREDMKTKGITMTSFKANKKTLKKKNGELKIPADENSEEYQSWKRQVAVLEKFVKRRINNGFGSITTNLVEYFTTMKQRIGYWLFDVDSLEVLRDRLTSANKNVDKKSQAFMLDEINNEYGLYFIQDKVNRFVVRVAIRIHSNNISKVSMIQSRALATEAMEKTIAKQQENQAKMNSGSSDKRTKPSIIGSTFIKPVFGHLIEPYCAYEQLLDPNDGTCSYTNNGSALFHHAKDRVPFSSSLCGRIEDFTHAEKTVETEFNSLYNRYKISEDVVIQDSEIVVKLKSPYWTNYKDIERFAIQSIACMFEPFGVNVGCISVTNHYTVDTVDDDIFLPTGIMRSVTSLTLTHKFDMKVVEKIPYVLNSCIRTSWPSELEVNSAVEKAFNINDTPDGSTDIKQAKDNKVIVGWRWRDVTEDDYDVLVGTLQVNQSQWSVKLMELRSLMGWIWINCTQAKHIVERFPNVAVDGTSPIENAIVIVFSRIIDLENFDTILAPLPIENKTSLLDRIGIFNAINFCRIDKINTIELGLSKPECRKLMRIVLELVSSGTISLEGEMFKETPKSKYIKGFNVPDSWSKSIPEDGILRTGFKIIDPSDSNVMNRLKKYNKKYCLLSVPRLDGNDHHLLDIENNYDNIFT